MKGCFSYDDNVLLVCTVYAVLHIVISRSRKQRLLVLSHYLGTAGYRRGIKLYFRIKGHFYWYALEIDCYDKVRSREKYTKKPSSYAVMTAG